MKKSSPVEPTLLFAGMLYARREYFSAASVKLEGLFGTIAMQSPELEWDHSDYYRDELGWPVARTFVFYRDLIDPLRLADIKLITNNIEQELSEGGRRTINIDPGYMTLSKVVLASTKNYSHRIYIGKGIFAELTLINIKGRYQPHLFTYKEYAGRACTDIFAQARSLLKPAVQVQT